MGPATASCGLRIISAPEVYSQPILLHNDYATLTASAQVDGVIQSAALKTTRTQVQAAENFFQSPDLGTLLTCTLLGPAVKGSLEGRNDTTTPTTAATPLPANVPVSPVIDPLKNPACASPATPQFAAPAPPY